MNRKKLFEFYKEAAEAEKEEREELQRNPLARYSTTELKRELRRRKNSK